MKPLEFEVTAILEHLEQRREFPAVLFERARNMRGDQSPFPILTELRHARRQLICPYCTKRFQPDEAAELDERF